jgi:hypothetical protein
MRATPSAGGLIGVVSLGAVLGLLLGTILALLGLVDSSLPVGLLWAVLFLSTGGAIGLGYLLFGYFTIGYDIGDSVLVIRWGNRSQEIPLTSIVYAGPAAPVIGDRGPAWRWFWPGYYVGRQATALGSVHVVATQSPSRQLLISTGSTHYAISPNRPEMFLERLARARRAVLGEQTEPQAWIAGQQQLAEAGWTVEFPTLEPVERARAHWIDRSPADRARPAGGAREVAQRTLHGRPLGLFLLEDRVGLVFLMLAVALTLAMVAYLLVQYEQLPQSLVLHWNANGLPDRIGTRRDLWLLPVITAIVTVANIGLAWLAETFDRFAARLLLAGACMVQLVAWVALLSILG